MNFLNNLERGFKHFLIKLGIFVGLFIIIQLITIPLQAFELPAKYYIVLDTDLGKALLFTILVFLIISKDKLKKIKDSKFSFSSMAFGVLSILIFASYFYMKVFLSNNLTIALDYFYLFFSLKYILLLIACIFLWIFVFGFRFSHKFASDFKKELWISLAFFIFALFLIIISESVWIFFSKGVASIVLYLLNLFTEPIGIRYLGLPAISLNGFTVAIDKPCSGIESIFLFTALYILAVCYDWKILNKKKAAIIFIPALISVYLLNIIRIFLLILLGAYVSRKFAVGAFHTSAGMILFLVYFAVFWIISYKWMKKK